MLRHFQMRHVRHVVDIDVAGALAVPQHIHRLRFQVAGALCRGHHDRAAAIGHQAAIEPPERIDNGRRLQHILDGHRIAEGGGRVQAGPGAGGHCDLCQGLLGRAVNVGMPVRGHGVRTRRRGQARHHIPLVREQRRPPAERARRLRLLHRTIEDQHRIADPSLDHLVSVPCVQHEGAAAGIRAIQIFRKPDTQILGQQVRLHGARPWHTPHAGDRQAIDIRHGQARLGQCLIRTIALHRQDVGPGQGTAALVRRGVTHADNDGLARHWAFPQFGQLSGRQATRLARLCQDGICLFRLTRHCSR